MGNAAFLLVALIGSVVGSVLLWLRHRRPKTFMSSIDEFQREMKALGHEEEPVRRRVGGRGRRTAVPGPDQPERG